ncbi:MAG: hypothetical protein PVF74_04625 [Anaerolineales bacterium]
MQGKSAFLPGEVCRQAMEAVTRAEKPESTASRTVFAFMDRRMRTRMSGGVRGGGG